MRTESMQVQTIFSECGWVCPEIPLFMNKLDKKLCLASFEIWIQLLIYEYMFSYSYKHRAFLGRGGQIMLSFQEYAPNYTSKYAYATPKLKEFLVMFELASTACPLVEIALVCELNFCIKS